MIRRLDWRVIAIVSAFVSQVFFFAPLHVFLNNIVEFSVDFTHLLFLLLFVSSGLIAVLYLAAGRLPSQIFLAAVTFLSVVAFIEFSVLFGLAGHRPFDGTVVDWEALSMLLNIEIAVILGLAILIAVFRQRQELFYAVSVFILLFHGIGFLHTTVSKLGPIRQSARSVRHASLYYGDFHRLSRKRNVIHIVADSTQGALVYDILTSDVDRYSGVFDGFTLFTHASGRYPNTYPSVSFYMTGRAPDPGRDMVPSQPYTWDYVETMLREYSIVSTLADNGFRTFGYQFGNLYCAGMYTACTGGRIFDGLPIKSGAMANTISAALELLDVALFRVAPLVLRRHIYNGEQWFLSRLAIEPRAYSGILDLFIDKITTDDRPGSYNYFHHPGGHPPLQFDGRCNYVETRRPNYDNSRAQVSCFLSQLEHLIQKLKQLGVYDQTLIIVHADHGSPWPSPSIPFPSQVGTVIPGELMAIANPVIFVKPLRTRGHLKVSSAPVSIGDVPATINDAFTLSGEFPGIPLFQLDENAERERKYFSYDFLSRVSIFQALPNMRRYRIRGNLFNQYDWIVPNLSDVGESPSGLPMNHDNFRSFAVGFGGLETHGRPMRWVVGKLARVYLSFPTAGRAQLVFDTYVPPSITGQSMEVSINGRALAKWGGQELVGSKKRAILLPDDLPREKVNTIDFTMSKTVKFETDTRHLSVLFAYVGLEPLE